MRERATGYLNSTVIDLWRDVPPDRPYARLSASARAIRRDALIAWALGAACGLGLFLSFGDISRLGASDEPGQFWRVLEFSLIVVSCGLGVATLFSVFALQRVTRAWLQARPSVEQQAGDSPLKREVSLATKAALAAPMLLFPAACLLFVLIMVQFSGSLLWMWREVPSARPIVRNAILVSFFPLLTLVSFVPLVHKGWRIWRRADQLARGSGRSRHGRLADPVDHQ